MSTRKLSYFYCELYDRIYLHCNPAKLIDRTEAAKIMGHAYNIPSVLRMHVIKEMELAGWIKKYDRFKIQLLLKPFNLKENHSTIGRELGLF